MSQYSQKSTINKVTVSQNKKVINWLSTQYAVILDQFEVIHLDPLYHPILNAKI
jgi:hypothetical protein